MMSNIPDVNNDDFSAFLRWLNEYEAYNVDQIIDVVSEPYKYKEEYKEFYQCGLYDDKNDYE
ncbi:MAG: hypothetical protein Unbinned3556contig1001_5 [Prokaryotic dsDNA virus sp.]|nr:MAG: hypothetical protein Unbinned3556contig1001_5 [Prokaryotic dsDNA virus sp.]|tara:strand:- start:2025 stop:2210 length:186 start_codon:yes stop_codon:yes gene_type:complete